MARRDFFAEVQHQSQVAAREWERTQRIAVQQHSAVVRGLGCRQLNADLGNDLEQMPYCKHESLYSQLRGSVTRKFRCPTAPCRRSQRRGRA